MPDDSLEAIREEMRGLASPARAAVSKRFFRTGPGEYGAGDVFLGLTVPQVRALARKHRGVPVKVCHRLLHSPVHEERQLALFLLVRAFEKGGPGERKAIYESYLAHRRRVNNWDLVDGSAPHIVGAWLLETHGPAAPAARKVLQTLARSDSLWDRRIAVLATQAFIRQGEFAMTLELAEGLLGDAEDLIHKAAGWMLREVGERDAAALRRFLKAHGGAMPRTMLRYAIEKLPERERKAWLARERVRQGRGGPQGPRLG